MLAAFHTPSLRHRRKNGDRFGQPAVQVAGKSASLGRLSWPAEMPMTSMSQDVDRQVKRRPPFHHSCLQRCHMARGLYLPRGGHQPRCLQVNVSEVKSRNVSDHSFTSECLH